MNSALRLPVTLLVLAYQSAFLALGQIWANKLRSLLTTVGIIIGVASVTAVIAALSGLKKSVLTEFETFGTNKIFILPYFGEGRGRGGPRDFRDDRVRFRPEIFDGMLEHCPSVARFTRICDYGASISKGRKSEPMVEITGIEPAWHQIESREVIMGRPFSLIDNTQARPVCIINDKVQDKLELGRDPVGDWIMIGQRRFTIVGVIKARAESSMFGGGFSDSEVFIPFTTARTRPRMGMICIAATKSPALTDEAKAELTFFMRRQRGLNVDEENTFRIESVEQFVQQFNSVATAITMVAAGIVGISLLVGGVGIMNIMLVSVSERTREIGLRKAVGARPSAILLQFLIEAMMLCFLGGLMGLLCGQGLTSLMASIPEAKLGQAYIPGWAVALSFGFSAAVGLLFGMFPAIKAARLDPIEALRHE
jgi:putative ABC transport system permease protein